MTRVLLVGASGQLGAELKRACWSDSVRLTAYDSSELDVTSEDLVREAFDRLRPNVVINAAAYTSVDLAEDEEERAMAVNATAVRLLAESANRHETLLIHVSTDYVFDGTFDGWYTETAPIAPLGVYGRTKAAGERAATVAHKSVTLRTSWVYGALGFNFVTTMLRLASQRRELQVVGDQVGCPTAAADLASAIVRTVELTGGGTTSTPSQLYHLASPESASWHDFALAIFQESSAGFDGQCHKIQTSEYPTKAKRPANSKLSSALVAEELGLGLPSWRESLPAVVNELEDVVESRDRSSD